MSSEANIPNAGESRDNALAGPRRDLLPQSPQDPVSSGNNLTHAERVERELAYLRRVASQGIWSAIE
jgi:hypothetical protein